MVERNIIYVVAVALLLVFHTPSCQAKTTAIRICSRNLGNLMSTICLKYPSPSWENNRRRRRSADRGIATECCIDGCTWEQLEAYCHETRVIESPAYSMESHTINDRSAESESAESSPIVITNAMSEVRAHRGEVGRARDRGYGRMSRRSKARGPKCWCRHKRRSRPPTTLIMGNMEGKMYAARAAPVVGTVSPLLNWGQTLHSDLPQQEYDRYAYLANTNTQYTTM